MGVFVILIVIGVGVSDDAIVSIAVGIDKEDSCVGKDDARKSVEGKDGVDKFPDVQPINPVKDIAIQISHNNRA